VVAACISTHRQLPALAVAEVFLSCAIHRVAVDLIVVNCANAVSDRQVSFVGIFQLLGVLFFALVPRAADEVAARTRRACRGALATVCFQIADC
jgi:hypothetical protein